MVAAQELLTTVSDSGEIFAYFSLSEQEALEWASAANRPAEVTLRLADGGEHPQPGVVDALGAELDPDTRTLQLRARFPNADGLLRHGGTATVLVRRSAADAVLVPQRATRDVQGNVYVYVVGADQVPVPRRIVAARRVGEDYWVSDGLAAGENIVLDGIQKLREGQAIVTSPAEQET
jgi:membrane fusion protein (multidrug efflux system)